MYTKGKEALMYGRNSYGLGQKTGLMDISKYDTIYIKYLLNSKKFHTYHLILSSM